jgi:hypothetical protein
MNMQESYSDTELLDLHETSSAQDYAAHALAIYRIGESADIKKAQMLWEYAKEYMLLSTRA